MAKVGVCGTVWWWWWRNEEPELGFRAAEGQPDFVSLVDGDDLLLGGGFTLSKHVVYEHLRVRPPHPDTFWTLVVCR